VIVPTVVVGLPTPHGRRLQDAVNRLEVFQGFMFSLFGVTCYPYRRVAFPKNEPHPFDSTCYPDCAPSALPTSGRYYEPRLPRLIPQTSTRRGFQADWVSREGLNRLRNQTASERLQEGDPIKWICRPLSTSSPMVLATILNMQ
jgi:hypothetical protein